MADTKETILSIISEIKNARTAGSITNTMVARVMEYLAESDELTTLTGKVGTLEGKLTSEQSTRQDEDTNLSQRIDNLSEALDTLMSGNASEAIDSYNEIVAFLDGIKDSENLAGLLNEMAEKLTGMQGLQFMGVATSATQPKGIANECWLACTEGEYTNFVLGQKVDLESGIKIQVPVEIGAGDVALIVRNESSWDIVTLNVATRTEVLSVAQALDDFKETKGQNNGIAPLNYKGLIPQEHLPEEVYDVCMCMRWDDTVEEMKGASGTEAYAFNTATKKLYKGKWYAS